MSNRGGSNSNHLSTILSSNHHSRQSSTSNLTSHQHDNSNNNSGRSSSHPRNLPTGRFTSSSGSSNIQSSSNHDNHNSHNSHNSHNNHHSSGKSNNNSRTGSTSGGIIWNYSNTSSTMGPGGPNASESVFHNNTGSNNDISNSNGNNGRNNSSNSSGNVSGQNSSYVTKSSNTATLNSTDLSQLLSRGFTARYLGSVLLNLTAGSNSNSKGSNRSRSSIGGGGIVGFGTEKVNYHQKNKGSWGRINSKSNEDENKQRRVPLITPLSADEIDRDLRHMSAYHTAVLRYHQIQYVATNRINPNNPQQRTSSTSLATHSNLTAVNGKASDKEAGITSASMSAPSNSLGGPSTPGAGCAGSGIGKAGNTGTVPPVSTISSSTVVSPIPTQPLNMCSQPIQTISGGQSFPAPPLHLLPSTSTNNSSNLSSSSAMPFGSLLPPQSLSLPYHHPSSTYLPVRIDPDDEKRIITLRKKIARAEMIREELEQHHASLREHSDAVQRDLITFSSNASQTLRFLQNHVTKQATMLAIQRTRLQMVRDAMNTIRSREEQVLEYRQKYHAFAVAAAHNHNQPLTAEELDRLGAIEDSCPLLAVWNEIESVIIPRTIELAAKNSASILHGTSPSKALGTAVVPEHHDSVTTTTATATTATTTATASSNADENNPHHNLEELLSSSSTNRKGVLAHPQDDADADREEAAARSAAAQNVNQALTIASSSSGSGDGGDVVGVGGVGASNGGDSGAVTDMQLEDDNDEIASSTNAAPSTNNVNNSTAGKDTTVSQSLTATNDIPEKTVSSMDASGKKKIKLKKKNNKLGSSTSSGSIPHQQPASINNSSGSDSAEDIMQATVTTLASTSTSNTKKSSSNRNISTLSNKHQQQQTSSSSAASALPDDTLMWPCTAQPAMARGIPLLLSGMSTAPGKVMALSASRLFGSSDHALLYLDQYIPEFTPIQSSKTTSPSPAPFFGSTTLLNNNTSYSNRNSISNNNDNMSSEKGGEWHRRSHISGSSVAVIPSMAAEGTSSALGGTDLDEHPSHKDALEVSPSLSDLPDCLQALKDEIAYLEPQLEHEYTMNWHILSDTNKARIKNDELVAMIALVRQETESILHRHNVLLESDVAMEANAQLMLQEQEQQRLRVLEQHHPNNNDDDDDDDAHHHCTTPMETEDGHNEEEEEEEDDEEGEEEDDNEGCDEVDDEDDEEEEEGEVHEDDAEEEDDDDDEDEEDDEEEGEIVEGNTARPGEGGPAGSDDERAYRVRQQQQQSTDPSIPRAVVPTGMGIISAAAAAVEAAVSSTPRVSQSSLSSKERKQQQRNNNSNSNLDDDDDEAALNEATADAADVIASLSAVVSGGVGGGGNGNTMTTTNATNTSNNKRRTSAGTVAATQSNARTNDDSSSPSTNHSNHPHHRKRRKI